jgi:hypothetical protein
VDLLIIWFGVTLDLPIGQVANLHSEVIKVISCQLMIGKTRTSVCHPQGNGQVNEAAILSPDINTCNDNVHYYYVYDNYMSSLNAMSGTNITNPYPCTRIVYIGEQIPNIDKNLSRHSPHVPE